MKKLTPLLATGLLFAYAGAAFAGGNMFVNKGAEMAAQAVSNPSQFFFDFQKDFETLNPLPPGKWFGINWHIGQFLLLPIPDPGTIGGSGKLKLASESRWFAGQPQIDVIGGYWTLGPVLKKAIQSDASATDPSTKLTKADFHGQYYGVVMTSSLEPRVRLFWGYKHSQMTASLGLNKPVNLIGTKVQSFDTGFKDDFLFAGLETPTAINKFWNVQFFYGLKTNDFGAKVSWYKKNFELGLNIYPTGVFVIHPVLNWHVNFG